MSTYSSSRHPSGYDTRPRGHRVCDNCGITESQQVQLKLCGQCKVTQYCVSKEAINVFLDEKLICIW